MPSNPQAGEKAVYVFEGKVTLGDFCRTIDQDEAMLQSKKGGADTLAGFIMELTGRIPEKNEKIEFNHLLFTIEATNKRTIQRVKVTIKDQVIPTVEEISE